MRSESGIVDVSAEFEGLKLRDARLNRRAIAIASRLEAAPGDSFPEQMEDDAELEGLYRFFANRSVKMEALLAPHIAQAHARMSDESVIRVAHDTTDFRFEGDREGLGRIGRGAHGFYAHMALAVGADERREPFGVLGARTHILDRPLTKLTKAERARRAAVNRVTPRAEKLSSRWENLAIQITRDMPASVRAIHLMDQEADDYALFAAMRSANAAFVIRGTPKRRLDGHTGPRIAELLAAHPTTFFRTITVNPRPETKVGAPRHPVRGSRTVELSIRFGSVELQRPPAAQSDRRTLLVNAVHVIEMKPPFGEEAIEWMLFTSESTDTVGDAIAVVDHYRARWVIEEYFKALKTGCAFEKRQLTTYAALLRALGLFAPIAWRLLALRHLGREEQPRPASVLFDREQLKLLRVLAAKRKRPLPASPNMHDAMLAVAAIGGHIRNNGDPGWIVLGRGFRKFLEAEEVWALALNCDQS